MKFTSCIALATVLLLGAAQAQAQSSLFDFEGGNDQGFGLKFSNDASFDFPIVNIGGSNRMEVPRTGGFQEADHGSGSDPFLAAMNAAVLNPSGYLIKYDYYIDTAPGNFGNFLQLGTYINSGGGAYVQDFPGTGKDLDLSGTQLGSGQVFQGTISETLTAKYGVLPAGFTGQTFQRVGFIINGDGTGVKVHIDNVIVTPVPEPTTLGLAGLAAIGGLALRRRK